MSLRVAAFAGFLAVVSLARGQQALTSAEGQLFQPSQSAKAAPDSAWLDLRQVAAANATVQAAPDWVESIALSVAQAHDDTPAISTFRIRVSRPNDDCQILFLRLFFDDVPKEQPEIIAWDESGSQVLHSGSLGAGTGLATSSTTLVPMIGVSAIDINVPGDGRTVRGAYLDWMKTTTVLHPIHAEQRELMPEPFAAAAPLRPLADDTEVYGTVTAPLAAEAIAMGPDLQNGASFQFELEQLPLVALLSFEVATPQIDSTPEVYVNGEDVGAVSLVLPDLADPAYRGMARSLLDEMKFQYTGWVRAQRLLPAALLKAGTNDVIITSGVGTPASAVRATQIQLKYLWDKSDYLLQPLK